MIHNWSHWYWKLRLTSFWAIAGALIITSSGNYAFAQAVSNSTIRPNSFRAIKEPSLNLYSIYLRTIGPNNFRAIKEPGLNLKAFGFNFSDFGVTIRPNSFLVLIEPSLNLKAFKDSKVVGFKLSDFGATSRPNSFQAIKELSLKFEAVDVSKLIDQSCSTKSEFFVTGRGGLPPTPREVLRSDPALVDLGPPPTRAKLRRGDQRLRSHSIENHSSSTIFSNPTNPPTIITEAQGWMANSKGEVVLTAQAPDVTPHSPWITSACYKLQTSSKYSPVSVLIKPGNVD